MKTHSLVARRLLVACALMGGFGYHFATPTPLQAQSKVQSQLITVTGIVSDPEGPSIGATVMEKGVAGNGTSTDIDGRFSLKVKPGATLVVSYVGCKTREIKAVAGEDMDILLQSNDEMLNEIVVVGFGTQKKVNLTGSVSVADKKALSERPVTSAAQALQGVVPGLQINNPNGSLESNPTMNIRGNGTIGDGSSGSPLILIDGMEGDINAINPQDIESISVLKDAAAASIYGSRAPFGVILVTTKRGTEGKPVINYNNSLRFSSLINMSHTMDSYHFAQFYNDGCVNTPGWGPHFNDEWFGRIKDYYEGKINTVMVPDGDYWKNPYDSANANVDWYDTVYKDHNFSNEHNLSVSGGTSKINYYVSGNFLNQPGMVDWGKEGLKRYTLTGKFNADLYSWMSLGFSTRWIRKDYIRPSTLTNNLYQVLGRQGWPILPIYDDNGFMYDSPSPVYGLQEGGSDKTQTDQNYYQLNMIFKPLKGWDIHAEFNYSTISKMRHWDSHMIYNHKVNGEPYVYNNGSNVHEDYHKQNFLNWNIYSNYDFTVAEKNNFHVMLGFQSENLKEKDFGLQRNGIIVDDLPEVDLTTGYGYDGKEITPSVNGASYEWSTAGFFGRLNYNYDGRYLAEVNLRYDGTSRFRRNHRWIWLPSASVGWNIAQEKFWESLTPYVNHLKLRASYGVLGNQNANNWRERYQTYRLLGISMNNGAWLQNGVMPNTVGYPGLVSEMLTWEKVHTWNIGLDWGLFNNRLTGSFEYFIRDTKNMVGPGAELPSTLGTTVPKTNNCDLRSHGWDLEIAWNDQLPFGLSYGARFVLSDARTKITRYNNNPSNSLDPNTYIQGRYINEIWGYETIGVARTNDEMNAHLSSLPNGGQAALGSNFAAGDVMYADLNGDGKIDNGANTLENHGDLKLIGNSTPRYMFSFDLTGAWKGFDLRLFFQGVMKRDYWQGSGYFWGIAGDFWWSQGLTGHSDYFRDADTWSVKGGYSAENTDSYFPRPIFGNDGNKNHQTQTRYLQDASYIRLKNLQVGYTLPQNLTRKIALEKVRVFFSAENLWTGTKLNKLFDPETIDDPNGWGGCAYPLSRTYSFGVSVTL